MRAGWPALVLLLSTLAGCVGAAVDDVPLEAAEPAATEAVEEAAQPPPAPAPQPEAPAPAPENATVALPTPDPCAAPVRGLDHACIADGFHFGEAVFWDGGAVPTVAETGTTGHCHVAPGCKVLPFVVAESAPGARLRVDVQVFFEDVSHVRTLADTCVGVLCGHETAVTVYLFPPGAEAVAGNEAARGTTQGTFAATLFVGGYDDETRKVLEAPAVGEWTMRIHGQLPDGVAYRMRAKLEAPAPPSDEIAYPDLRIIPPFEVGFMAPTSTFQPGAPTPVAVPVAGCMAEEYVEAERNGLPRPTLCLRFSMGFANAGEGNWRLKMLDERTAPALPTDPPADIPVVQSVCTPDGRLCRDLPRPEGLVTRWDDWHGHYHYQNAYVFDLHRVVGDASAGTATLDRVSTSGKLGIDPGPETLVGWNDSFTQRVPWAPEGTAPDGSPDPADKVLQAGWGDVYDWNRAGNYVPFPADATGRPVAGEYVLVGRTDPDRHIAETDETNNVGYTHFRVAADGKVVTLERGYGTSPWDPAKSVLDVTP